MQHWVALFYVLFSSNIVPLYTSLLPVKHILTAIAIFTQMEDKFFPSIWHLCVWARLKFTYKALKRTVPNRIALNRTRQSHTKACFAKSCEIFALQRQCRVVIPDWSYGTNYQSQLQGFRKFKRENSVTGIKWHNLPSGTCKSRRENTAWQKLSDTIFSFLSFFLSFLALSIGWFLKNSRCFISRLCCRFQAKMHLICWTS